MDEKPLHLLGDRRPGQPMTARHNRREDSEYVRCGTCSIFMFNEPLGGKRYVSAREHRTKKDWAFEIHSLLTKHYPHAEKVILVMDNLNTHTIASLYEAFPADKALEMAQRLEIHFTPQTWELAEHGRDRVKRVEFPMLKPPDRQSIEAEERDPGVAARSEQE